MDIVEVRRSRSIRPSQRWYWRRVAPNGKVLAVSSEGYRDRDHCLAMARRCNAGVLVEGVGSAKRTEVFNATTPPAPTPPRPARKPPAKKAPARKRATP